MAEYKSRKCLFCGKEFIPVSGRQLYCKEPHVRICPVCGKEYLEDNTDNLKRPPVCCSYECRAKKTRQTSLERYGVTAPGNSPVARQKAQITMQNRYGVNYTLESEKLKNKANNTLIEKYGASNLISEKRKHTYHKNIMNRYNEYYQSLYDITDDNTIIRFSNKLYHMHMAFYYIYYLEHIKYTYFIENQNILIDFGNSVTEKNYHLYKSLLAEDNGFRCIHVFDWDDADKVIGMLKPKTKISADSCQIWHLKSDVTNDFLDKYDLQGRCRNQLLCLGLVKDGEILQVMTFGKSIYDKNHNIVIRRMCTKFGYDVIGGYHKMLHYATEVMELYGIMVYVDIAKCDKSLYENLDMTLIKRNPPRKVWFKDRKYKLDYYNRVYLSKNKDFLDCGKSYDEFMMDDGWEYTYDCGQYLFEY